MSQPQDRDLLLRARDGDLAAFEEFVRLFERRVRALLSRLLDDLRDVDEAAQDVFVQAWRNLDHFRGDAAPFTWLYRIAVNEALQRTRRRRLDTRPLEEEVAEAPPETTVEDRELEAFLAERLRELPFELRAPLVLRDLEGWSNKEVAEARRRAHASTKGSEGSIAQTLPAPSRRTSSPVSAPGPQPTSSAVCPVSIPATSASAPASGRE